MSLSSSLRPVNDAARAFSIIEVTIAVGLIGFCLIAVIGLLPTGLNTHRAADEEARAATALNMVASAAESLRYYNPQQAQPTWAFPHYFSDNPDPVTTPTIVWVTQQPWTFTFFVSDGGMIIPSNDTVTRRRQTLFVQVYPPDAYGKPVRIYAAVAWPYRPTDRSGRAEDNATTAAEMVGRQGFVDTLIAFTPTSLF